MANLVQFNPSTGKVNVTDQRTGPAASLMASGAGLFGGVAGWPYVGNFVPICAAAFSGVLLPFNSWGLELVQMFTPITCASTISVTLNGIQPCIGAQWPGELPGCFEISGGIDYGAYCDFSKMNIGNNFNVFLYYFKATESFSIRVSYVDGFYVHFVFLRSDGSLSTDNCGGLVPLNVLSDNCLVEGDCGEWDALQWISGYDGTCLISEVGCP